MVTAGNICALATELFEKRAALIDRVDAACDRGVLVVGQVSDSAERAIVKAFDWMDDVVYPPPPETKAKKSRKRR